MTNSQAFILVLGWVCAVAFLIMFIMAVRLNTRYYEGPPPCRHRNGRQTQFVGMDALRMLFSGEMSVEEYRKADVRIVHRCNDCGVELD